MKCSFKPNKLGTYTCEYCGFTFHDREVQKNCKVNKEPPLYQKIINFAQAAVKHAIKGNPVVSEEVVLKRLEICKTCPLFKPNANQVGGVCTHSTCGCTIQDNTNYLNKIAWADQKCPIDKWGEENPDDNKKEGV
jgi:hypothetical protein